MQTADLSKRIEKTMQQQGWKWKMVSVEHVLDLQEEIEARRQNGQLDEELFAAYLNRFDFDTSADFKGARSLIVVIAPQPQVRVTFRWQGRSYPTIIPPTYYLTGDDQIQESLAGILTPAGYRLEKKRLPPKLLVVRSGLARYGKNNITYAPGMGSYHRPAVFVTDMQCLQDSWGESRLLKACEECTACLEACPTGAIASDRFLLRAERCITFHNERPPAFPQWLHPAWHNSLVGCMFCQNACPLNTKLSNWIEDGAQFCEDETSLIVEGKSAQNWPHHMLVKLEKLGMAEYVKLLGRNLKALLVKNSAAARK